MYLQDREIQKKIFAGYLHFVEDKPNITENILWWKSESKSLSIVGFLHFQIPLFWVASLYWF